MPTLLPGRAEGLKDVGSLYTCTEPEPADPDHATWASHWAHERRTSQTYAHTAGFLGLRDNEMKCVLGEDRACVSSLHAPFSPLEDEMRKSLLLYGEKERRRTTLRHGEEEGGLEGSEDIPYNSELYTTTQ